MNFDSLHEKEPQPEPLKETKVKETFEVVTPDEIRRRVGDLEDPIHSQIRGALYNYCGNKFENEIKDLHQTVLVKILGGANGFKSHAKFSSWVFSIVRNVFLDFVRSKRGKEVALTTSLDDPANEEKVDKLESKLSPTEAEIINKIHLGYLTEGLPKEERELLEMKKQGLKNAEISEKLEVPKSTISERFITLFSKIRRLAKKQKAPK